MMLIIQTILQQLAALLEPAMIAAVDLNQFAVALTPQTRLMEGSSPRSRQP